MKLSKLPNCSPLKISYKQHNIQIYYSLFVFVQKKQKVYYFFQKRFFLPDDIASATHIIPTDSAPLNLYSGSQDNKDKALFFE